MTTHHKPTEKELEILQVLWSHGPTTVRVVNDHLGTGREIGYTTTLKLMQIMFDKGLVSRRKDGKTHIYSAEISEERAQNQLIDRLLDTAFKGSAMRLVMQALGHKKTSKEELEEIRKYIDQLEGGMK